MSDETKPYIPHNPGDLVTAEDWNEVQKKIKEDIAAQTKKAVDSIEHVPNADNASKLENKTSDELAQEIIKRALQEIAAHTGYLMLFRRLKKGDEKIVKHNLRNAPLVDVYQLEYFPVVCSKDEEKEDEWVNFYLYHTSEKRIKNPKVNDKSGPATIEIEPANAPAVFKVALKEMLDRFHVKYSDDSSLGDLIVEFWKALFKDPNDEFDEDQYCHSPWFDKCCGDERTVGDLKKKGEWDDIWFKMIPRKTINFLTPQAGKSPAANSTPDQPAPTQVQVVHFDFDSTGIKLLEDPVYPDAIAKAIGERAKELKVMLLLKV